MAASASSGLGMLTDPESSNVRLGRVPEPAVNEMVPLGGTATSAIGFYTAHVSCKARIIDRLTGLKQGGMSRSIPLPDRHITSPLVLD